jgi:hypothetical protein
MKEAVIKTIMVVSGVMTFSMVYAAIAPEAALRSMFGETLTGPVAEIVVRTWGAMIAVLGAALIYGAYRPAVRSLVLIVAAISKTVFVVLLLVHGRAHFAHGAGVAVWVDSGMVLLYVSYLATRPRVSPLTAGA